VEEDLWPPGSPIAKPATSANGSNCLYKLTAGPVFCGPRSVCLGIRYGVTDLGSDLPRQLSTYRCVYDVVCSCDKEGGSRPEPWRGSGLEPLTMLLPSPQRGQERAAEAIHNDGDYSGEAPSTEPLWWSHKGWLFVYKRGRSNRPLLSFVRQSPVYSVLFYLSRYSVTVLQAATRTPIMIPVVCVWDLGEGPVLKTKLPLASLQTVLGRAETRGKLIRKGHPRKLAPLGETAVLNGVFIDC